MILFGGKNMGFRHGQYLNCGIYEGDAQPSGGAWRGGREAWQKEMNHKEQPLGKLFLTMLHRLGVKADSFAGCSETLADV